MKKGLFVIAFLGFIIILLVVVYITLDSKTVREINSFEECVAFGFPVMESYPRQCRTADGRNFVEIVNVATHPLIKVFSPGPNDVIASPLKVAGEARGNWFFEASFPIELLDANDNKITLEPAYIMTSDDWMVDDFVSFDAIVEFSTPQTQTGTLILYKDNPSGLPENDDEIRIPVKFNLSDVSENNDNPLTECKPTGCSGQICADEDLVSTCEFLPHYICYSLTSCERQPSGECGWAETSEFLSCLETVE
jgi:hypothetical protein